MIIFQVIDNYYPETNWDKRLYCAIIMIPLILLGQIRNLKYLVPFSALANVLLLITLAIIMSYIFTDIPSTNDKEIYFTSAAQLPLFIRYYILPYTHLYITYNLVNFTFTMGFFNFSTVIFAMEGIGVVMPVENDMKNPRHFLGCPGVLNVSMSIVVTLYAIIGIFGYLRYGDEVDGNITATLAAEDMLVYANTLGIITKLLNSFNLYLKAHPHSSDKVRKSIFFVKWGKVFCRKRLVFNFRVYYVH